MHAQGLHTLHLFSFQRNKRVQDIVKNVLPHDQKYVGTLTSNCTHGISHTKIDSIVPL